MKGDRSHWKVRKVSFAEAEERDDDYYASLTELERLEVLIDLRSMLDPGVYRVEKVIFKKRFDEKEA